jgi:uncharacterized membrane protein (UPF0127 family)
MSPFILRVRSFVLILGLAAALAATAPRAQTGPQPPLPTTRLTAGMHIITAELATTPQSRTIGMMFREKTAPNHGMLFVFEYKAPQCFWMRNTPLPLSIAFIEDDGTIVQITDMAPKNDALHCSKSPVRFALEMEQGWFARKGLAVGAKLGGLPASR